MIFACEVHEYSGKEPCQRCRERPVAVKRIWSCWTCLGHNRYPPSEYPHAPCEKHAADCKLWSELFWANNFDMAKLKRLSELLDVCLAVRKKDKHE